MVNNNKKRMIDNLKWARLVISSLGAMVLLYEVVQKLRGAAAYFDYYKVGGAILGLFCILLAGEHLLEDRKGISYQFLFVYGLVMIIMTLIT